LFDGGVFFEDKTELGNSVNFADGRLGVIARFQKHWEGKVEFGYTLGQPLVSDAYVAYNREKWGVQVGWCFEPFGIDGRMGTADYRLMNAASSVAILGDKRKVGIAYTYRIKPLTFVGGFFSDADVTNLKNDDAGYTIAAKVAGRPVYEEDRLIHIGMSARYSEHDRTERERIVFGGGLSTFVLNSAANRFVNAEVTGMINQWKYGVDVIGVYKNLYFQAEYASVYVNRLAGLGNYAANGGYAQFGLLLLGTKRYAYNPSQGWVTNPGAKNLELLVRYNITNLNDRGAGVMGGQLQDVTFGANYFINRFVAVRVNYVHAFTDEYSATGNGKESFSYVQGRVQVNF
jgi:phosphate-selective porin OprO/OprP